MAWASKTYTFSPSTTILSSEVNQNFDDMVSGLETAMPSGGIIMWSGSIANIPSGWYLCDGNNGTPNLQDRFIVGAGSSYAVGATGGSSAHTLTSAEMPSHTHSFSATSGNGGGHGHTLNDPGHTHSANVKDSDGSTRIRGGGTSGSDGVANTINSATTGISVNAVGDHTHAVSGNTGGAGSGSAHENRPPYLALAFIMKS